LGREEGFCRKAGASKGCWFKKNVEATDKWIATRGLKVGRDGDFGQSSGCRGGLDGRLRRGNDHDIKITEGLGEGLKGMKSMW